MIPNNKKPSSQKMRANKRLQENMASLKSAQTVKCFNFSFFEHYYIFNFIYGGT